MNHYIFILCNLLFQVKAEDVNSRVETVLEELRTTRNEVSSLRSKIAVLKAATLASKAAIIEPQNVRYLLQLLPFLCITLLSVWSLTKYTSALCLFTFYTKTCVL
jgi:hypothetical protein